MRLFLILLAVPIIEIALFIEVGGWIGAWPTIAIVVLTALAGSILLRRQGLAALHGAQGRLAAGESPGHLLADGAMIVFAGALLLTPGFFTDAVGLALLVPAARTFVWQFLSTRIEARATHTKMTWYFQTRDATGRQTARTGQGQTVDGTYTEVTPEPPDNAPAPELNGKSGRS